MNEWVSASDGARLHLGDYDQVLTFDSAGKVTSISVETQGATYVQTITYTGDNPTGISRWERQP